VEASDLKQLEADKLMADVTKQGKEKIREYVENELAETLLEYWRGNLTDSQQSLAQDLDIFPGNGFVQVGSKNEVLKFLEFGTRPHTIVPDEAQALRWFNDAGDPVFATRVEHPGFEPFSHGRNALGRLRGELQ